MKHKRLYEFFENKIISDEKILNCKKISEMTIFNGLIKVFDSVKIDNVIQVYNFSTLLLNTLISIKPESVITKAILIRFYKKKISPLLIIFNRKNTLINLLLRIKYIMYSFHREKYKDKIINKNFKQYFNENNRWDNMRKSIYIKDDISTEYTQNETPFETNVRLMKGKVFQNYKFKLSSSKFEYEMEVENINIIYKLKKIQYISIDLFIQKIYEGYFNNEYGKLLLKCFIFQCFGFISYDILLMKIFSAYKFFTEEKYIKNSKNLDECEKKENGLIDFLINIFYFLHFNESKNISFFSLSPLCFNMLKETLIELSKNDSEIKIKLMKIKDIYFINNQNNFNKQNLSKEIQNNTQNNNVNKNNNNTNNNQNSTTTSNNDCQILTTNQIIHTFPVSHLLSPSISSSLLVEDYCFALEEFKIELFRPDYSFDIFKFNSQKIARILTKISSFNYAKLKNNLFEMNPEIKNKKKDAKNLFKIIDFSNKLSYFVIEEILSYDHQTKRAELIEKIIDIAFELKKLNNLNDLLSIVSGLSNSIIQQRLTLTWNNISYNYKIKYRELTSFCTFEECYKNFKSTVENCIKNNRSFIPHIGIHLKYINFYQEKQKYTKDGLICLEKIMVNEGILSKFLYELQYLCNVDDKINTENKENLELYLVFSNLNPKSEDKLYDLCNLLEPKFTLYAKQEKRKRQTNTDKFMNLINKNNESFLEN